MSTTAPPDFSSFEKFNNEFSALIDNMLPKNFGASSTKNGSSSAMETADEIIERNRAKKQKERHRNIISGGQAEPQTAASSISATTLPLANALSLKRRRPDDSAAVASNGHTNGAKTKEDSGDDDDEEESRTRVVAKKSKTTRDAFSTKKSGKVKIQSKLAGQTNGKGKMPVAEGDVASTSTASNANVDDHVALEAPPTPSKGEPQSASSYNPFKIPSTPFSSTQTGIKDIFSPLPTPTSSAPQLDTLNPQPPASATSQAPTSDDPARTRTGMTPPPGLHGKERKRWRKKMKKMQMKKDGEEKAGGDEDEGDED